MKLDIRLRQLSQKCENGKGGGNGDGHYPDPIDESADSQARAAEIATQRIVEMELAQARHAAHLQENGRYGKCELCGKPIDPERLEVFPEATLCINCARKIQRAKPVA